MGGRAVFKNSFFGGLRTAPPEPPTANRRPPPTGTNRQTANRHQPPTVVQYRFCEFVSGPCLDHEAESVPREGFVSVGATNPFLVVFPFPLGQP